MDPKQAVELLYKASRNYHGTATDHDLCRQAAEVLMKLIESAEPVVVASPLSVDATATHTDVLGTVACTDPDKMNGAADQ